MQPSLLLQVFIRALRARPTAGPVNKLLWEAKQVWQNMLILYVLVYHRVYNTYYKCLVQQQQYEYITTVYAWYATLFTENFTCNIFGTTAAVTTVVVLTLNHRYYAWPQDRLQ